MNEAMHRDLREQLGWYAIGRADETQRIQLEAHLDGCDQCRAELAELRGTVARLDLVDPDRINDFRSPPAGLGDEVIAHVLAAGATPTPRRKVPALLAAAAAVLLVGLGAGWLLKPDPAPLAGPPTEPVTVQVDEPTLNASAKLVNHTWGVEIQLTATGFEAGEAYRVQIVSTTGQRTSAGEFVGTGTNQMRCNLNSSVLRPAAAGFEVLDDDGAVLLTSAF